MSGAKELKDRIKAVQETKKITSAMYLISSTKLRRAKAEFTQAKPYFDTLRAEVGSFLRAGGSGQERYFAAPDGTPPEGGECAVLIVTADKGLAGAYNDNVLHAAEELLAQKPDAQLYIIGDYGRRYFAQHRAQARQHYVGGARAPTPESAGALGDELLKRYESGELNEVILVYTDMKNSLSSEPRTQRLLPLPHGESASGAFGEETELLPTPAEVVHAGVHVCVRGLLYGALLDSYCAEQNARVTAMDSANRNAQELLGDLSLQLNRTRQAAITREITEISAGAQAQRTARKKKGGA